MKLLKEEHFDQIKSMLELTSGKKLQKVADLSGFSYSTICQIKKHDTYQSYRTWLDDRYEVAKAKLAAKKQTTTVETTEVEETVAAFVPDTESLNQPVTKQDLAEMEARLSKHISKQIGGLRVYVAGPNNARLVKDISETLLPADEGKKARFLVRR